MNADSRALLAHAHIGTHTGRMIADFRRTHDVIVDCLRVNISDRIVYYRNCSVRRSFKTLAALWIIANKRNQYRSFSLHISLWMHRTDEE